MTGKSLENQWKINDFSLIFHWFLSVLSCIQRWTLGRSRIPLRTCILAGGGSRRRRELCGRVLLWKKSRRKRFSCMSVRTQKTTHILLQWNDWLSDVAKTVFVHECKGSENTAFSIATKGLNFWWGYRRGFVEIEKTTYLLLQGEIRFSDVAAIENPNVVLDGEGATPATGGGF